MCIRDRYETFKKTFRYFLLRYSSFAGPHDELPTHFKDNVTQPGGYFHNIQPGFVFFDILQDASEKMVRLGLNNETTDEAWATMINQCVGVDDDVFPIDALLDDFIDRNDFDRIWALYRSGRTLWKRVRQFVNMRNVAYLSLIHI